MIIHNQILFYQLYGGLYGQTQLFNIHSSDKKEREETTDENLNNQEDFLCSGNIVGELGLLTKSVRSCSVSCETDVQVRLVRLRTRYIALNNEIHVYPGEYDSLRCLY